MGIMADRTELADFLRRRRELLSPAEAGLPAGPHRLRREEVAVLAGVSVDHYTRLEQARGSSPSASVVGAIAGALQCDLDQRDHLYYLAGLPPPARRAGAFVRPGLAALADRLIDVPVLITTDVGDIVWRNVLGRALLSDWADDAQRASRGGNGLADTDVGRQQRPRERNMIWRWFTEPSKRQMPESEWPRISAAHVGDLRAVYARRSGDPDVASLVTDLLKRSEEFRTLWERHDVAVHHADVKTMLHPEVGEVRLHCEVLLTPDEGIQLLAFFPLARTDAANKLELLRVIGTQQFHPQREHGAGRD